MDSSATGGDRTGEQPSRRVSAAAGMPMEATQGVAATAELPYDAPGLLARIGGAVRRGMVAIVARPKSGFEPAHPHDRVIGVATLVPLFLLVWVAARQRFGRRG